MNTNQHLLPGELFKVRVPLVYTYTPAEIEAFGLPIEETTSGTKQPLDDRMVAVMLPLARIIEIYNNGAPIQLLEQDKLITIYNALENYMRLEGTVSIVFNANKECRPYDNIDIDRFAAEIFDLNRADIVNQTVNRSSGFDIGISKVGIPNLENIKHKPGKTASVLEAYKEQNPSISEQLNTVYVSTENTHVDPDKVKRNSRVPRRKRQKVRSD